MVASGTLLNLSRFQLTFEIYGPTCTLRTSEALSELSVTLEGRTVYSGRAVVSSLVHTGTTLICEVKLEDSWQDLDALLPALSGSALQEGFSGFLQQWHKIYRISPEFKATVADMHTFLSDLRLWLEQVDLAIRSAPSGDRAELERDLAHQLSQSTTPVIGELFEKFEAHTSVVEKTEPDQSAAHSAFVKRLLHPLLLSSPFLYRTFRKPLGYAGDYEMVNMICRDPLEGSTLFAKIINAWFLHQPPAEAHRLRVTWLCQRIAEVTARAAQAGKTARIVSVGCGPALEVQRFLAEKEFADRAQFTLIDFNHETIEHVKAVLDSIKRQYQRRTPIQIVRKSVNQILKEAGRRNQGPVESKFDFVYCAGLFDYLSDQTCQVLSNLLYDWVVPGGLFVSTNVDSSNPRRLTMDYIMDWHLIYRRGAELAALQPELADPEDGMVTADHTGVNVLYTVRKPERG